MSPDLLWQALGPFAVAMALAVAWIQHLRRALAEERARAEARTDALLELAQRSLPALEDSTSSLRESAAIIRRQSELLAIAEVAMRDMERCMEQRP